jgi:hypothetical protein
VNKLSWTYGDAKTPVSGKSRHYADLNLHVETTGYAEGDVVDVEIALADGKHLQVGVEVGKGGKGESLRVFRNSKIAIIKEEA